MRSRILHVIWVAAAAACGSAGELGDGADGGGADASDADLRDAGDAAETDAAAPAPDADLGLPTLAELATCPIPAPGARPYHIDAPAADPARNLHRATVDLADHPAARCNDGTPAVYYVRAGSGAGAARWHVHLQGGGACASYQECLDRWCNHGMLYDATKMSSAWAPAAMEGLGIYDARAANQLADWNHVFVYYCSSDSWSGQAGEVVVTGDGAPYTAHFRGHDIVAAVLAELRAGAVSDDGAHRLPSLDDAARVVLSGTSAGGGGVRVNADWLGAVLRASNPDVDLRAVVDAGFQPGFADHLAEADYQTLMQAVAGWTTGVRAAFRDESCLAAHAAEPWRCDDLNHVLRHHLTTPVFVRMDLRDPNPLPWVNPLTGEPLGTVAEFAALVAAQLEAFPDLADPAGGAEEAAGVTIAPGAFGPQCGAHTALTTPRFFNTTLPVGGEQVTFHDLLVNWLTGAAPSAAVDDPESPASGCP